MNTVLEYFMWYLYCFIASDLLLLLFRQYYKKQQHVLWHAVQENACLSH